MLGIRGTDNGRDMLTDVAAASAEFGEAGGGAHEGISKAAMWFADKVGPILVALRSDYPDFGVVTVGHRSASAGSGWVGLFARPTVVFMPECWLTGQKLNDRTRSAFVV